MNRKRKGNSMKCKVEFYRAFFETLEKKGFSIAAPSSPDYVADIFYRKCPVAFFAKNDTLIRNLFVEVEDKIMERLQSLAKTTAIACGICADRPYDEEVAKREQNGVVKINEQNGVVLACKHHPIFEYVLSTYKKEKERPNFAIQRQYFYNKEEAYEDFAVRSGMVDEKKLFSENELKMIYRGLLKVQTLDQEFCEEELEVAGKLIDKIEELIPELGKKERGFDFMKLFSSLEKGMER